MVAHKCTGYATKPTPLPTLLLYPGPQNQRLRYANGSTATVVSWTQNNTPSKTIDSVHREPLDVCKKLRARAGGRGRAERTSLDVAQPRCLLAFHESESRISSTLAAVTVRFSFSAATHSQNRNDQQDLTSREPKRERRPAGRGPHRSSHPSTLDPSPPPAPSPKFSSPIIYASTSSPSKPLYHSLLTLEEGRWWYDFRSLLMLALLKIRRLVLGFTHYFHACHTAVIAWC